MGDVDLGVHTIHMQLSKALGDERKQDQYLSNVWQVPFLKLLLFALFIRVISLKVNSKLGGINHLVRPLYGQFWCLTHCPSSTPAP
jgi:hypothetical protein